MEPIPYDAFPLWLSMLVFAGTAVIVWLAGTRLANYAGITADRTGIGNALLGLLLLGSVTSLPEVATSVTASLGNNANLAVGNLLGGVSMQVVVLVAADFMIAGHALTATMPRPAVAVQGVASIVLLALVVAGTVVGEVALFGVGIWSTSVMVALLIALWISQSSGDRVAWVPKDRGAHIFAGGAAEEEGSEDHGRLGPIVWRTIATALAILVAGYVLTRTGESIAARTGLGDSFFGAVFLAIATSLPELSSVTAAIRMRRSELAFGDVFGGNLFDLGLIFVVDAIYRGPPVLDDVAASTAFLGLLGIVLTSVLIGGLLQRRDRVFLRLGYDSLAIVTLYLSGLAIVYSLQ